VASAVSPMVSRGVTPRDTIDSGPSTCRRLSHEA
jgi:hypothetical protein